MLSRVIPLLLGMVWRDTVSDAAAIPHDWMSATRVVVYSGDNANTAYVTWMDNGRY